MKKQPCDSCEARPAQVHFNGRLYLCGGCFLRVEDPRGWNVINERSE